ncbi:hypothetical protein DL771_004390 [Monosporascus sp. 5C6A]|nr:hypothetical protein DL771_004390 [Monosporascus sp. 5C6A]
MKGNERNSIEPRYFKAYYRNIDEAGIPSPHDFKTVAGNANAKSQADAEELVGTQCTSRSGASPAATTERDAAGRPIRGRAPGAHQPAPTTVWHGDFIRDWLPEAAHNMILATAKRNFQVVDGNLKPQLKCTPQDDDPENGTDDYEESFGMMAASPSPAGVCTPVFVLLAATSLFEKQRDRCNAPFARSPRMR